VDILHYTRQRLQGILDEVSCLAESDFPYPDPREALNILRGFFENGLKSLSGAQADDAAREACAICLRDIFLHLPLLGFISRSTDVRNSFEMVRPFTRLAGSTLKLDGSDYLRLILSSEWEYSPFVYIHVPAIPCYMLIGLPASESSNPLLLPLAGHELGHRVYEKLQPSTDFETLVAHAVVSAAQARWGEYKTHFPDVDCDPARLFEDSAGYETLELAVEWALRQAEETFCDFLALRIFGQSLLYATAYLLSPRIAEAERPVYYPNIVARIDNLMRASEQYGVQIPTAYRNMFSDLIEPNLSPTQGFLLSLADEAVKDKVVPDLINIVDEYASDAGLPKRSHADEEEERRIRSRFDKVAPAEDCSSIAHILNAAWGAYEDESMWQHYSKLRSNKRRVLSDLILKSLEVFEIEQVTGGEHPQ